MSAGIREQLGVSVSVTANVTSDALSPSIAQLTYTFGVNHMPTREEVDAAIKESIASAADQIGDDGLRLTTLEDFGFSGGGVDNWELPA